MASRPMPRAALYLLGALVLLVAMTVPARAAATSGPRKLVDGTGLQLGAMTPTSDRLVYRETRAGTQSLSSVPLSGGAPVQLSAPLAANGSVAKAIMSQDGGRVAYTAAHARAPFADLYVVPMTGGTPLPLGDRVVSPGYVTEIQFTPDGERIVYAITDGRDELGRPNELYTVPSSGGVPAKLNLLRGDERILGTAMSADGRYVVYQSQIANTVPIPLSTTSTSNTSLNVSTAADTASHPLLSIVPLVDGTVKVIDDAVSPWALSGDGRYLIYAGQPTASFAPSLYAVDLETGTKTSLGLPVDTSGFILAFLPSPSHALYLFGSSEVGPWDLYSAPLTGGVARKLNTEGPVLVNTGSLMPGVAAGRVIFYGEDKGGTSFSLFSAPVDGRPLVRLSADLDLDVFYGDRFVLSKNGRRVVYLAPAHAGAADQHFLSGVPVDGSTPPMMLGELPAVPVSSNPRLFAVSPDGNWVIYPDYGNSDGNLRAVRTDGSARITLNDLNSRVRIDDEARVLPALITPDSRRVVFEANSSVATGATGLYVADLVAPGSTLSDITPQGGSLTSADGALTVQFPAGTVGDAVTVEQRPLAAPREDVPAGRTALRAFTLEARDGRGDAVTQFGQPLTLIVQYTDSELAAVGLDEASLNLAFWNGNSWADLLPCDGCGVDADRNRIVVRLDHFTEFALLGQPAPSAEKPRVFLPLSMR
jgi:Tol biopolymer transport system component